MDRGARTGRCHPPLYAADPGRTSYVVHARPSKPTPEVSGSSGPHCVEQVDFWGGSLGRKERATPAIPVRVVSHAGYGSMPVPLSKIQPTTGHEFHHGHGPCRGTVFPHPTPSERVSAWRRGAATYFTPEVGLFRSGWDFLFGHHIFFGPRLLQTGLEEQAPAVCIPPGFFLLGSGLRMCHKTKDAPSGSP